MGLPMLTIGLAFPNLGGWELLIILIIALLLFGRRLPEVGRSVGRSIVEFRKGIKGIEEEIESESRENDRSKAAKPPLTSGQDVRVSRGESIESAQEPTPEGPSRV